MALSAGPSIGIIGAGFSGLCVGKGLRDAGFDDLVIFEKGERVGGTWRDNVYPGAACDSPSFHYCYSFEPKADWSRKWARQPEILAYIEQCARKYDLVRHLRLNTEVTAATWSEERRGWDVRTADGKTTRVDVLVSAVGQLNRPYTPPLRGLADFEGPRFHSAQWDRSFDPTGKRIAVVGTAASAVQLVPEVGKVASQLFVLQRSPNWIFPKQDRVYGDREKALYRLSPTMAKLHRWWLWLGHELRFPVLLMKPWAQRQALSIATKHLEAQVPDPDLRRLLTPSYPIGAKRILITDDYYPALLRENVKLVTEAIDHVDRSGIVLASGDRVDVDAIVLATGFETTTFLAPMTLRGTNGRSLHDAWSNGAEALLGMSVAGFPNLFLMYGPNTNLGHNSIIFMLECQTRYILDCLKQMRREGLTAIDVRADEMEAYNQAVQAALAGTVWASVSESWYKNSAGRIVNNWPHTTTTFWWRTRRADLSKYRCERGAGRVRDAASTAHAEEGA